MIYHIIVVNGKYIFVFYMTGIKQPPFNQNSKRTTINHENHADPYQPYK